MSLPKIVQILNNGNGNRFIYVDGQRQDVLPEDEFLALTHDAIFGTRPNIFEVDLLGSIPSLKEKLPADVVRRYESETKIKRNFIRSFQVSRFDISKHNLWDFVPERQKSGFLEAERAFILSAFTTLPKPQNYDLLFSTNLLLRKIEKNKIVLKITDETKKKFARGDTYIKYNLHGAITGRLSTTKGSFPIMTFDKTERKIMYPRNDVFVEFDYNGAEIRTLFNLMKKEIENDDVYDFFGNVFAGNLTRKEIKDHTIRWLYNPKANIPELESIINRQEVVGKFWKDGKVINPFLREIPCDEEHALNYLLQSTTNDVCLSQAKMIDAFLEGNKIDGFVSFLLHDSVVLDMKKSALKYLKNIKDIFEKSVIMGQYKATVSVGENFGEMKKIKL